MPLQTVGEFTVTGGKGSTVIVKIVEGPGQPLNTGVTVMVPEICVDPPLARVKDAMFPVPEAGNPMEGLLLIQL